MADVSVVDLEGLLAPIEGESPVGADLREDLSPDSPHRRVKDARTEARDAERQAVAEGDDVNTAALDQWRTIEKEAAQVLAEQSKDLEIACWYLEALVRLYGFQGLAEALTFINRLVTDFWEEGLYPQEDEDGVETRVAPLTGLNGEEGPGALVQPLKMAPITNGVDPGPYGYWQYEQALEVSKIADPEKRDARIEAGAVTYEQFESSVAASTPDFLKSTDGAVASALESYQTLDSFFRERLGDDAPPSSNIMSLLTDIRTCLHSVAKHVLFEDDAAAGEDGAGAEDGAAGDAVGQGVRATLNDREEALKQILRVADYFDRTEPHSPIGSTLREVVRRARMPLPELLQELIPDEDSRRDFLMRAGIRPPQQAEE